MLSPNNLGDATICLDARRRSFVMPVSDLSFVTSPILAIEALLSFCTRAPSDEMACEPRLRKAFPIFWLFDSNSAVDEKERRFARFATMSAPPDIGSWLLPDDSSLFVLGAPIPPIIPELLLR